MDEILLGDRLDPRVNAVIARDVERARADADEVDRARARGEPLGPLAGLPMTVKGLFDIEARSCSRPSAIRLRASSPSA
jgi:Asp-tRNA(Asn)/Glu-tRNA(Gln) amidotransferase A subunit family amidase